MVNGVEWKATERKCTETTIQLDEMLMWACHFYSIQFARGCECLWFCVKEIDRQRWKEQNQEEESEWQMEREK